MKQWISSGLSMVSKEVGLGDERTDHLREGLVFAFGEAAPEEAGSDRAQHPAGMLRIACHELVNPLATIQLCAESLISLIHSVPPPPASEISDMAQRIEHVAARAVQLIDDVLAVDRGSRGTAARDDAVDIDEALDDAIGLHAEMLDRAGCSVLVSRGAGVEQARGRWKRQALDRLFSNLFQNVARHAAGAPVFIHLSVEESWLCVRFADRGHGLSATKAGRHGLGLWIIHRAVTELAGEIQMNSTTAGLTFDIKLPLQDRAGIAASLAR